MYIHELIREYSDVTPVLIELSFFNVIIGLYKQ